MKHRLLFIGAGVCVLALVIWAIMIAVKPRPNVNLLVSPRVSEVFIKNTKSSVGELHLRPGQYTVLVTMDGFDSQERTIKVSDSANLEEVVFLLQPNSKEGEEWLIRNPDEALYREELGAKLFRKQGERLVTTLPITKELPFIDLLYRVDYGSSVKSPSDEEAFAIYVSYYSEQGKADANDWLRFKGVDLNKTEIIYRRLSATTPQPITTENEGN